MIEVDETILDTIIEAKKNNKLAFFIGAGFSKNAETNSNKIPLWSDLISDLKKSLNIENENDFLKIAQLYYLKYGEYEYYNKLKKYFELNLEPSEVHKKLFSLLPNLIVTTNWDCILEHTAIQEGLTYDVIASDVDLVKSSYFHKIVKMHGDFQHHNIVFKEDDYLKYSDNFPLLENYLKSILSTHVVVFIGYSYSDIDLKLITKWIETKSKVTPPKYLFSARYNEAEASYLKNHGIQFLNPKDEAKTKDIILDFFNIISEKNELLRYKKIIEKTDYSFDEKLSLVRFFYEKIKNLNELQSIFPNQIREIFSNSAIEYHIECYALYLNADYIMNHDSDELVLKYYKAINEIIVDSKDKKNDIKNLIINIFYIFKKANIVFLKFSSKDGDKEKHLINIDDYMGGSSDKNNRPYLNFKSKGSANDLIFLEDYEGLSKQSVINIYLNIKERSYINLAINSFNNEISQRLIKADFKNNTDNSDKESSANKNDVKIFKDYFEFYGLTNKKEYNFINGFLNFNVIDSIYRSTSERIKANINKMKNIKNGGLSISFGLTEEELTIESLLDFIYKNNIAMEAYKEVKSIFENHIDYKIKLIEINYSDRDKKNESGFLNFNNFSDFSSKPDFRLSIMDLFIILNFSDSKKVIEILRNIKGLLEEKRITDIQELLKGDFCLKDYFVECFENIKFNKDTFNDQGVMRNLILMSSLCDWDNGEYILNKYKDFLSNYMSFGVFESVNSFVAFNSFFIKSKTINFIPYVDFLINSVMDNKSNNFIFRAIEQDYFSNTFNYMSWRKDYCNVDLIKDFIHFLNFPNNVNKDFYSIKIIPYLLYVSNDDVKDILRGYIFDYFQGSFSESKFELFILAMVYDQDFLNKINKETYEVYLSVFEKYCDNDFCFKNYLLKQIIISLSKNKKSRYKIFRDLKRKYNL